MAHAHCMLNKYSCTHIHTHSQYVTLIALPLQQRLQERASVLRYTYTACLVWIKVTNKNKACILCSVYFLSFSNRQSQANYPMRISCVNCNARKWNAIFISVEFYSLFDSQQGCTTTILTVLRVTRVKTDIASYVSHHWLLQTVFLLSLVSHVPPSLFTSQHSSDACV